MPKEPANAARALAVSARWRRHPRRLAPAVPLIAQVRTGYAEVSAIRMGEPRQLEASVAANSEAKGTP